MQYLRLVPENMAIMTAAAGRPLEPVNSDRCRAAVLITANSEKSSTPMSSKLRPSALVTNLAMCSAPCSKHTHMKYQPIITGKYN